MARSVAFAGSVSSARRGVNSAFGLNRLTTSARDFRGLSRRFVKRTLILRPNSPMRETASGISP